MPPKTQRTDAVQEGTSRHAALWRAVRRLLGRVVSKPGAKIVDRAGLRRFLESRSSYVAQTTLYGYLRARAGTRFPELFASNEFVVPINVAKWYLWIACLSDLSLYAGGMLWRGAPRSQLGVGPLMRATLDAILTTTGVPPEAGAEFKAHAERLRARLAACDWASVPDDETPFTESPSALVRWAPIAHELQQADEEMVRNSVRFRWQDVRRELRRDLDAPAVLASADP
jgi:hypothetical protein